MSIINITKDNFEKEVLQSDKRVLLDFWATWCGPCQMFSPIVEEFAKEHEEYVVGKVNTDEEKDLALQFEIYSIPTVVVLDKGTEVNRLSGVLPMDILTSLMKSEE